MSAQTPAQKGKPVSNSRVEMSEVVLPFHTNQLGSIFGGQIMSWIDIAAALAAVRHARTVCVTASIDALSFLNPVRVGQFVILYASVNFCGRTSMEVGVRVESEDPQTGTRTHVSTAYLTFVSLDQNGQPKEVPPLIAETPEQKRRYHEAQLRRKSRLKLKEEIEKKEHLG